MYEKNQTQILQEVKSVNFAWFPQILDLRKSLFFKRIFLLKNVDINQQKQVK